VATDFVNDWLHYLEQRGRSPETIRTYQSVINAFAAEVMQSGHGILTADVDDAQRWWDARDGQAVRTRARALSCVRSFYKWALRHDMILQDPTRRLDAPSLPKGAPRYITKDQLGVLREKLEPDLKRAALLGAWAGLRVSEAAALMWGDVDTELMRINVRHGKGDKARPVGMASLLLDELAPVYADNVNVVTGTEQVQSAATLQRRINRAIARAGVDATFHQLRHRFGTITYGVTGDPLAVAAAMGHSSLETTRIYAAVSDDALARVAAAAVRGG
jgi:site-specific recombinase XerD